MKIGKDVWEGDLLSSDGIVCEVAYDEYLASFHLIIDKIKGSTQLGDMMRPLDSKSSATAGTTRSCWRTGNENK